MFDDNTTAFAAGLAVTLVLAAFLTPRHWWRRPNLRALAVLGGGTWAIGSLLLTAQVPAMATAPAAPPALALQEPGGGLGVRYRVFDDLNLRAASGTHAARVAVVPAGAIVTATGVRDGDWWQVSTRLKGKDVTGWSSSLWLRRADEGRH